MKGLRVPTAELIISTNKYICSTGKNPHHCFDQGKIESSLHSAFYPGSYPFAAGGLFRIAAALCFYLIKNHAFVDGKKRTAVITALTFLNENGLDLKFAEKEDNGKIALTNVAEGCAEGRVSKDQLMDWLEVHKARFKR